MVEIRFLFPASLLSSNARSDQATILPSVLAWEDAWAKRANAERMQARGRLLLVWLLPLLFIIGGATVWTVLYLRYGREYGEENPPEYVRELPDDSTPNEVSYLWRWANLGPQDMTATLMDLVRRGALRLRVTSQSTPILGGIFGERTKDHYIIERIPDRQADLRPSERYLVSQILFHAAGDGNLISFDTFLADARSNPTASQSRFKLWKSIAEQECKRRTVVDPQSKIAFGTSAGLGLAAFILSVILCGALETPTFMASAVFGFILMVASYAILRRTPEAARALHRWQAFRRYLTDFSQLDRYPAPAVVLWEHYLVYAIALGVAARVIEQFKELYPTLPKETAATAFPHWVTSSGTPLSGMQSISSVLSSFNTTLSTATSSFSSSSGSGGGFSGGGGGGGGGGSSGAR
jgi:uncharacterized membrane protein